MTNREISRAIRLTAELAELYGENDFKIKALMNGAFQIEKSDEPIEGKSLDEILAIPGVGKGLAHKILELIQTGTTLELQNLLEKTPNGILELLSVKGIGPKKLAVLWKELGVESPGELLYACNENRLVELKGFGEKSQKAIGEALSFSISSKGKLLYNQAFSIANDLIIRMKAISPNLHVEAVSQLRRKMEVVDEIHLLAEIRNAELIKLTDDLPELIHEKSENDDYYFFYGNQYKVRVTASTQKDWQTKLFILTGPDEHIVQAGYAGEHIESEEDFYHSKSLPFILPETRDLSLDIGKNISSINLVSESDIRGCIHVHSNWSDGVNTIRDIALFCRKKELEYLVITDHSKSAAYAGGLSAEKVKQQHREIEELNMEFAPFRIFKGIESDILADGSLDYSSDILKEFDFVIASVHSGLKMDKEKATQRLLQAIQNPYTTMLGHPTGRLLLSREGYEVDYEKIIEACAAYNVSIELNSNPLRLDISWRFIQQAMAKGVLISVNPDAHHVNAISDMKYGIEMARKGGLTKNCMLNGKSLIEINSWLSQRKP